MDEIAVEDCSNRDEQLFSISFMADEFPAVTHRFESAGYDVTGYSWEALVTSLLAFTDEGARVLDQLDFNCEHSSFAVYAEARAVLDRLALMLNEVLCNRSRLDAVVERMSSRGD